MLVEDDPDVASALMESLEQYGWDVEHSSTGGSALYSQPTWDIVLLDLNLPDMDGLEVCQRLRSSHEVPIIAVTARSDQMDKVLCLRLGADDYIVKPYQIQELLARMTAVIRRSVPQQTPPAAPAESISEGQIVIDRRTRRVSVAGRDLALTRKEFDLLVVLARAPGRVFTRDQLFAAVWSETWGGASRTLDTHVASLRRKLGSSNWIRTIRGVGFSFEPKRMD
ncbi:response regulator transcription factor [Streptomyces sp. NPDC002671]